MAAETQQKTAQNDTDNKESKSAFDIINGIGEYLFTVLLTAISAIRAAALRACDTVGRAMKRLGGIFAGWFRLHAEILSRPFERYSRSIKLGNARVRKVREEKGALAAIPARVKIIGKVLFGKRGIAVTICNYALPVISMLFLFSVVTYANNQTYAVQLNINGEFFGYIDDETVFTDAERMVQQRITYMDSNTEIVTFEPSYSVAMVGYGSTLTKYQLADKMLSSIDAEIEFAYGLYIGNSFYGAVVDRDKIDQTLEDLLDVYRTGNATEKVEFESKITYEPGLYLSESIVSENSIIRQITSKKSVAAYYTAVEGDSPIGICSKLDMTYEEMAALNPGFGADTAIFIGDKFLINQEEPFLAVTVTRQEVYDERTPYETVYQNDSTRYEGSSVIVQSGERGTDRLTADVSYINGVEVRRKVLNRVTVSEPVDEVVSIGTKPVPINEVVSIQNVAIGEMYWPVGGSGGQISEMMYGYGGYYDHSGIDIVDYWGAPIVAADSGKVILASWYYGYGNCIMIQHSSGIVTVYGHLSQIRTYVGEQVTQGQLIGDMGATGQVTGTHLHFEVRINGVCYNPINYLPWHRRAPWCVEY